MADFNRSLSIPVEVRTRARNHVQCPRCRLDPARHFWNANEVSDTPARPDSCRRSIPRSHHYNHRTAAATAGYYANVSPRYNDTHSTRSAGDTWRIRGILENHQPDVTRRADSSLGRLPDVTHHSGSIQHSRTRSVPVGGAYDSRIPASSSYDIPHLQQPPQVVSRSYTQGVICARNQQDGLPHPTNLPSTTIGNTPHRSEPTCVISSHNKKSHKASSSSKAASNSSPWITRDVQIERQAPADAPSTSHQSASNSSNWSSQQQPQASTSWRPSTVTSASSQNVLTQCPLPDLVTPRRQARKQCCGLLATHSVAIRWLVVVIAILGLVCSIVGTTVGVLKANGRDHLTVALLLIGLGIVLVSLSGVAWRLTSRDSPTCRAMFGLRRTHHEPRRRFVPRVPHYGRPHPFSAMLYPDITLRPPPPSYQASMQEYRLRLLLMDRQTSPIISHPSPPNPPPPPPPLYRGPATVYPRFPVNIGGMSEYSRPPSYRSRPSSAGQPSPVGPEDVELINNPAATSSSHLASDVMPTSLTDGSLRVAPSIVSASNHVEVVAQV